MSKIVDYKINLGSLVLYETLLALEETYESEKDSHTEFDNWLNILNEKSTDEIFDLLLSMG